MKLIIFTLLFSLISLNNTHAGEISPRELMGIGNTAGKCEIIETMFFLRHQHFQNKQVDDFLTTYMNAFLKEIEKTPTEHQAICKDAFKTHKDLWKTFDPKNKK